MAALARDIAAVRRFNRFYTRELGLLRRTFLDTPYSLGEARILLEIGQRPGLTASEIAGLLELDAAYLSRLLARFEKQKLIVRTANADDARHRHLALTAKGEAVLKAIDVRQAAQTERTLAPLSAAERKALVDAMATIEAVLGKGRALA